MSVPIIYTQKKRGTFSPSSVVLRSWTTLHHPTTTSKAHAIWRERRRFTLGGAMKVSKFQNNQIKLLRFFLFYDVHIA